MIQNHSPFWLSGVLLITIPVMMPIGILLYSFFMPSDSTSQSLDIFEHIRQTVLPIYLYNTLLLMAFVGIAASDYNKLMYYFPPESNPYTATANSASVAINVEY